MNEQPILGRRIVVWGATGSGKSTFTQRLGAILDLGVVELDAIAHADGWDSNRGREFGERLAAALDSRANGWVSDGNYGATRDIYLSRADTLVWLNLPWRVSFWRLLQRTVHRAWTKEPLYPGSPARESWRLSFASRNSILWWSISHHRTHVSNARQRISELPPSIRVYELRSAREVDAFLRRAEESMGSRDSR